MPVQARSRVTVEVILDATIQVLLVHGLQALTTARVAARAGVSVGSIYQYYPNKQALLLAVLARHLDRVVGAVEDVCREQRGSSLEPMAHALVQAYMGVKLREPDVARAMYALPSDASTDAVVAAATARGQLAVCDLLASCSDARVPEPSLVAAVLTGSLIGPVQMLLTGAIPMKRLPEINRHVTRMIGAYLRACVSTEDAPRVDARPRLPRPRARS